MAELAPADLESYTQGRLKADDPETQNLLNRALAGARRFCGWVVTPQFTGDIVLDGPGTRDLVLPTMNLTDLTACIEDGVSLDVTTLAWSRQGIVRKLTGTPGQRQTHWCRWSHNYGAIRITVTHGYLEADAEDWRGAVLKLCDLASQNVGPTMQMYRVDDIIRQWFKPGSPMMNDFIPYQLMGVA